MVSVRAIGSRFATADAVYGTILFSALMGALSDDDSNALEVLIFSVLSLIVFWGAHVYAGTITGHGAETSLGVAFRHAAGHSSGMLLAAIPATIVLILGAVHVLGYDESVSIALLVNLVILGIIGYRAFAARGSKIMVRILGALGTAFFGFFMVLLNLMVH